MSYREGMAIIGVMITSLASVSKKASCMLSYLHSYDNSLFHSSFLILLHSLMSFTLNRQQRIISLELAYF